MHHTRRNILTLSAAVFTAFVSAFRTKAFAQDDPKGDILDHNGAGLINQVAELIRRVKTLEAQSPPPVGTIMAYAGEWPRDVADRDKRESEFGWMLCDGRTFDEVALPALKAAIGEIYKSDLGKYCIPELRGYFLRGLDENGNRDMGIPALDAEGVPARDAAGNILRKKRELGVPQDHATSLRWGTRHGSPFSTDKHHGHTHNIPTTDGKVALFNPKKVEVGVPQGSGYDYIDSAPTDLAGDHAHTIVAGGDPETCPSNMPVNFIIRVR